MNHFLTTLQFVDTSIANMSSVMKNAKNMYLQHKCAKDGEPFPDWTATIKNTLSECGYESGNRVNCSLRAATKIGPGPTEEIIIHVTCDSKQFYIDISFIYIPIVIGINFELTNVLFFKHDTQEQYLIEELTVCQTNC